MSIAYGIIVVCSGGKMVVLTVYHEGRMKETTASRTAPARPLRRMNFRHWIRVRKKNCMRNETTSRAARAVTARERMQCVRMQAKASDEIKDGWVTPHRRRGRSWG
jgi:hypothetical protein